VHRKLGNRSRAAFFLEQAAASKAGSSLYERAQLEIRLLEFPVLVRSGLGTTTSPEARFRRGQSIDWWGELGKRYLERTPPLQVEWVAPDGQVAQREQARPREGGRVTASFAPDTLAPLGSWLVRVRLRDGVVDQRHFHLDPALP
jgi:hypothetical protein